LALTVENDKTTLPLGTFCGRIISSMMLHNKAHLRTVRELNTILSLRLISICVCLLLLPRPHAEGVYADAKQVRWNKAQL
jgi:hypothetical protein